MGERVLIACCTSGLANRMLVLAGAQRVAAHTQRKLLVYWPVNDQLGCEFDRLFSNSFSMLHDPDMHALLRSDRAMKVYNARHCTPLYQEVSPDGDPAAEIVVIKAWTAPKFANETLGDIRDELCTEIRQFIPADDLIAEVRAVPLPQPCFGVHVRHGPTWKYVAPAVQSKREHFEVLIDAVVNACGNASFALATTQPDVEKFFMERFRGKVVLLPKSSRDRDAAGVREALLDLLLLSRTQAVLGTFGSTFSQVAAMLGPGILIPANPRSVTEELAANTQRLVRALDGRPEPHLEL